MELRFRYRKPDGEEVDAVLINWREDGRYLLGFNPEAGQPRTYRKDRVLAYQDGCEHALRQPFEPAPPVVQHAPRRPEILFTGFALAQRRQLESYALASGFQVVKSPTQQLDYLCCGPNAGPTKIEKARQNGAWLLEAGDLVTLVNTGELPEWIAPDVITTEDHNNAACALPELAAPKLIQAVRSEDDVDYAPFLYGNSLPVRHPLTFLYPMGRGSCTRVCLGEWLEYPRHVEGWLDGRSHFFDKCDMLFVDASICLLQTPFVPALLASDAIEVWFDLPKASLPAMRKRVAGKTMPSVIERRSFTKQLAILVYDTAISERLWRKCMAKGVVCCESRDFLAWLDGQALHAPIAPDLSGQRVPVELPKLDEEGHFVGWYFQVGRAHFSSLDVSLQKQASGPRQWTRGAIPDFGFSAGDVFNSRFAPANSFQIESVASGHNGWVVLKQRVSARESKFWRCRKFLLPHFLQSGVGYLLIEMILI